MIKMKVYIILFKNKSYFLIIHLKFFFFLHDVFHDMPVYVLASFMVLFYDRDMLLLNYSYKLSDDERSSFPIKVITLRVKKIRIHSE